MKKRLVISTWRFRLNIFRLHMTCEITPQSYATIKFIGTIVIAFNKFFLSVTIVESEHKYCTSKDSKFIAQKFLHYSRVWVCTAARFSLTLLCHLTLNGIVLIFAAWTNLTRYTARDNVTLSLNTQIPWDLEYLRNYGNFKYQCNF